MKKAAFHTLGCKVNFAETSSLMRLFRERGYDVSDSIAEPADICVINTCTVTEKANRECRQIIRRTIRNSPDAYIIVLGCYAQISPEQIASIDGVDLVLGSSEKFSILDYADGDFKKESRAKIFVSPADENTSFSPAYSFTDDHRTRAYLKIQDGCDYTCSFCTIPQARGSSRSQPVDSTIENAKKLISGGYKEIVLTGVNVGDYGSKTGDNLLYLVKKMSDLDGLKRLRISSIEPNLLTDELLDFWSNSPKLMHHFHIPLQSGNNEILGRMRRRYTAEQYLSLIHKIRNRLPLAGIGVDVITGFPGETDSLFSQTYRFLTDLPVSYLHVFSYSERSGTPSAAFDGYVNPKEKVRRTKMLRNLSEKKKRAFYDSFIGRDIAVLFEESDKNSYIKGISSEYVRVMVRYETGLENNIARVRIVSADHETAYGEISEISPSNGTSIKSLNTSRNHQN